MQTQMKTRRTGARVSMLLDVKFGEENNLWPDNLSRKRLAEIIQFTLGQEGYHIIEIHVTWTQKAKL